MSITMNERRPLLVVQNNLVGRLTEPLAREARALGIEIHDQSITDDYSKLRAFPDDRIYDPLIYGSVGFVHHWAANNGDLSPHIFWDDGIASAATWAQCLRTDYLNYDGETVAIQNAVLDDRPRHYRPIHTGKSVIGGVYDGTSLKVVQEEKQLDAASLLWSSPPKRLDAEVRCWFVKGRPITQSLYRLDGKAFHRRVHPLITRAVEKACDYVDEMRTYPNIVCDVGLHEGRWKLIEFNSIHTSGWYDANIKHVLTTYFELTA